MALEFDGPAIVGCGFDDGEGGLDRAADVGRPQLVPTSALPAASAWIGTSERLVRAIDAAAQLPPSMRRVTAAAAVA